MWEEKSKPTKMYRQHYKKLKGSVMQEISAKHLAFLIFINKARIKWKALKATMYQIVTILSILANLICLLASCPSGNILWQLEIHIFLVSKNIDLFNFIWQF